MNDTQNIATDILTYSVDNSHSRVGFVARHLGFSKVRGSFGSFEGSIQLEPGNLETLVASATIQASTVTTGEEKRDAHLKSPEFFDVEKHPQITFQSKEVKRVSGDSAVLVGDLTIRGITKSVDLVVEYLGESADPWGGTRI